MVMRVVRIFLAALAIVCVVQRTSPADNIRANPCEGRGQRSVLQRDHTGMKMMQLRCRDSQPHGIWREWAPNGVLAVEIPFVNGQRHGLARFWDRSGEGILREVQGYQHGRRHGPFKRFTPWGQSLDMGTYREGHLEGFYVRWYPTGALAQRGYWWKGQRQGRWTRWYDNGELRADGHYLNNRRSGEWIFWFEHGQRSSTGMFLAGERHAAWFFWHANGRLWAYGDYRRGVKHGLWLRWDRFGVLLSACRFDEGVSSHCEELPDPSVVEQVLEASTRLPP